MYIPEQGDIVWCNFSPTKGRELKYKHPGLILSSTSYNIKTKFAIITPITSSIRKDAVYYTLNDYKTQGQVITHQIRSIDILPKAKRELEFIERMKSHDFLQIAQMINYYFDFNHFQE